MASWADKIPTFNPYVQQLPVEAMVKVGMAKQQQYEEGLQKIQTSIDNIAGLDVGRDVDKKYLQSKLDALGNNLKLVAAGDFSNFQLVNSVSGMAKQISKDQYVQSAVISTANDRKQSSQIEEDREKGTLTPHAEYYYNLKRNAYYNNESLKGEDGKPIVFSGKYVQSWDIDKNILEAIKAVGDSKWTTENVFKMDANNQIMKDKSGAPIYSEYAIKEIREGRFSENVSAAIDSVLTRPEANQELTMRGVYNYRGYNDINQFIKEYDDEKNVAIKNNESKKFELMAAFTTEKDPEVKKQIQSLITRTDAEITSLQNNEDPRVTDAKQFGDLDAYKAAKETRRVRNQYMTSGVTEKVSREYIKSIPYEVGREKIKEERDWWVKQDASNRGWFSAKDSSARGWANISIAERTYDLNKRKTDAALGVPGAFKPGDYGAEKPVQPGELYASILTEGEELTNTHNGEVKKFVFDYIKSVNYGNGKDVSDKEVYDSINKWSSQDPNWLTSFYDKAKTKVKRDPNNKFFSNLATNIPKLEQTETAIEDHSRKIKAMNEDPEVIASGGKVVGTENMLKGFVPFTIDYEGNDQGILWGGERMPFQAQKQYKATVTALDVMNAGIVQGTNRLFATPAETALYKKAKQDIETKFGVDADIIIGQLGISSKGGARVMRPNQAAINKIVSGVNSQKFASTLDAKEKALQKITKGNISMLVPVYGKDAKGPEINTTNDNIQTVLNTYKGTDIDVSNFTNAFAGKNTKGYTVNIGVDRSGYKDNYTLELYDGKQKLQSLPITDYHATLIKPSLDIAPRVSRVQQLVHMSGDKQTTNSVTGDLNKPGAYKGAMYKQNYFINKFNRQDIYGSDIKINGQGQANLYLYKKDRDGDVVAIPIKGTNSVYPKAFTSVDDAEDFLLNTLNSSGQIDNFINNYK